MIGKLTGQVDSVGEDWLLVDVNGVGYVVHCTLQTRTSVPTDGRPTSLFIETHVREDSIKLFGFLSTLEREWFTHLQSVQGVGARVALAILEVSSPAELELAVTGGDKGPFSRATGVGPKLASRLVAELSDKPLPRGIFAPVGDIANAKGQVAAVGKSDDAPNDLIVRRDAISALVNLGYNESRARDVVAAVQRGSENDPPIDELLKKALVEIAR